MLKRSKKIKSQGTHSQIYYVSAKIGGYLMKRKGRKCKRGESYSLLIISLFYIVFMIQADRIFSRSTHKKITNNIITMTLRIMDKVVLLPSKSSKLV